MTSAYPGNACRFRDLPIGAVFRFGSEWTYPNSGMKTGPWRKVSARDYVHEDDGMRCRVGSINVDVCPCSAADPDQLIPLEIALSQEPNFTVQELALMLNLVWKARFIRDQIAQRHTLPDQEAMVGLASVPLAFLSIDWAQLLRRLETAQRRALTRADAEQALADSGDE